MSLVLDMPDDEELVKAWLNTTSVAALVSGHIHIGMPKSAPVPSVIIGRIGGNVPAGAGVPAQLVRMSFDCWHTQRTTANRLATALVTNVLNLGELGGFYDPAIGRIYSADVLSMSWLPDPESDLPRYVVDGAFTTIS